MADSQSVAYKSQVTVTETLGATGDLLFASEANRKVIHDQYNTSATLNASSSPPATKVASWTEVLTGGTDTIDLTALVGTHGVAVTGSGLRIQVIKIKAASGNSACSITFGAANALDIGVASFLWGLGDGDEIIWKAGVDGTENIDGTHKNIDCAGTASDELMITVVMG